MKKIIVILIVLVAGIYGYPAYEEYRQQALADEQEAITENFSDPPSEVPVKAPASSSQFQCDGRTHCSNMTSCAEATFFLQNCPGVEMDGDNDGVPCESQWCS